MPDVTTHPRKSRLVKVAAIVLAAFLLIYTGLSVFGAVAAMQIPRLPVKGSPSAVGLAYQNVSFTSRVDDLLLTGWYIPGGGEKAIIVVHGGAQNRVDDVVDTLDLARDLNHQGFDILLFDLRGRGDSQGSGRSLLNIDRDLGGAFDYVKSRGFAPASIGILGFCSGAASACIFASREDVGALVLNGCFASVTRMIYGQAAERHIPSVFLDIFLPGLRLSTFAFYHYREVDPIQVVGNIKAPVFFIHEQKDDLTTLGEIQLLLEASTNPADTLWEIPAALHSEGYRTDPSGFVSRVAAFFNASLTAKTP
jgi:pimeloyl-ACP methyl ester carboxylesterase